MLLSIITACTARKRKSECPKGWYCSAMLAKCRRCAKEYKNAVPKSCIGISIKGKLLKNMLNIDIYNEL